MTRWQVWLIGLALLAGSIETPANAEVTGTVRVVDGDTLEMLGQTIKLFGVDAIERDQLCLSATASRNGSAPGLAVVCPRGDSPAGPPSAGYLSSSALSLTGDAARRRSALTRCLIGS